MNKKEILKQAILEMKNCVENKDYEAAHLEADEILCSTLKKLGFEELVNLFEKVHKWYA